MSHIPVNPNILPLLHGLKPYLAKDGQVLTEGVMSVLQLLSSEHGKEAIATMSRVFTPSGSGEKAITINTGAGPITFSLNLVFVLFLILILLILSGNLLALSPGFVGGNVPAPEAGTMV